jgi:hypothetical protein
MATLKTIDITGMNKGAALEALIRNGSSYKEAEATWKKDGARSNATGFRAVFYKALEGGEALDSKATIIPFMESNGASANDIKQFSHFLAIAHLVAEVRAAK